MIFKNFTGGMNTYDPPDSIGENEFELLENACYEEGNLLRSRGGFLTYKSATSVKTVYPYYISDSLHLLYSCSTGLYDNSTLLTSTITGAFIVAEHDDMAYICNGTYYYRYDGTTLYNVGVAAPDAPTVAVNSQDERVLENFDTTGTPAGAAWAISGSPWNGGGTGTCTADAVVKLEGSQSRKITIPQGTKMKVTRVYTAVQDWTKFDSGENSSNYDSITFNVRVANPDDLRYFQVIVDADDGDFNTNYYYSGPIVQGERYETIRRLVWKPSVSTNPKGGTAGGSWTYVTRIVDTSLLDSTETILPRVPGEWATFNMAKADFRFEGKSTTKNWSTVKALGFVMWANDAVETNPVTVNIDDGLMVGGAGDEGSFYGTYYFCSCYYNSTRAEYYEVSEESAAVVCDLQGVVVSGIPATFPDAQADQMLIWVRREDWSNWFLVATVDEGTTSVTISMDDNHIIVNPELTEQTGMYPLPRMLSTGEVKTRDNSNNSKPPVPSFIIKHRGKMLGVVGAKIYHAKPGMPWAVPTDNYLESTSSSEPITGMYSDGANLIAHSATKDYNYINAGEYDGFGLYMGYLARGRRTMGCVSKYTLGDGLYASPFGIAAFDGQDAMSLSTKIKPTYRNMGGKTALFGAVYEDMYFLLSSSGYALILEMEGIQEGGSVTPRFYKWTVESTPACCEMDGVANRLYIGTSTGIYYYSTSTYVDSEASFTFKAHLPVVDFGAINKNLPLEAATIKTNTGGNDLTVEFWVDEELMDSHVVNTTEKEEVDLILSEGCVGSFLQIKLEGTVTENAPIKVYQIEVS